MEPWELGVGDLRAAYSAREISPSEVVQSLLERIEAVDASVGAFRDVAAGRLEAEAEVRTEELARGESRGELHGIPVAVKELFDVNGASGCYGSMVFHGRVADADAEAVSRLRSAGGLVIGVTRSHELGWGITTQHTSLGSTSNPWALDRVPGGSSGGSAAALATGMAPLALGSDTGGSIRIPAAFCGVTGIKPTYGRISKRGAVALAPSLDHPGPMARSVEDLIAALEAMAGFDPEDASTIADPLPDLASVREGLAGMRIAVAPDLHLTRLAPDHQAIFDLAVETIANAGARLIEVRFDGSDGIRPVFAAIQMAEARHYHSTVLGTFPSRSSQYGDDVRGRLEDAGRITLDDYLAARHTAGRIRRDFDLVLDEVDAIVTPVSAGGPSRVADPENVPHGDGTIPFRDLVMDYTVPQDLTGHPAVAVRAGFDGDGLPVGIQFTAARYREDISLRAAAGFEAVVDGPARWPSEAELGAEME